ncbi:MAG: hypothetical protein WBD40_05025 [Tepidisphaeraceae bacterium]
MPNGDERLPAPHPGDHNVTLWLDEQIWGHRLWDSQTPWLLFLEFLNIAEGARRQGKLLDNAGDDEPISYRPYRRMFLRNILFNNDKISEIDERFRDSSQAWTAWLKLMSERAQAVTPRDFSYLKIHFHSFHDFASLVAMLRTSAVESETNKRWNSRFVFPFGPNGLYVDLAITPTGDTSREYINFGRTGELIYLMLSRSTASAGIRPHLERVLAGDKKWNRLLGLLQPETEEDLERSGKSSYLPYRRHPTFDRLAEDWLRVFELGLPGFDAFPHLVTLSAFHVLLYQLTLAAKWAGTTRAPHMVCEVVAPRKTLVRERSSENYQDNNLLTEQAVRAFIKSEVEDSPDWQNAVTTSLTEQEAFAKCRKLLADLLWWGEDYDGPRNPEALISELKTIALKRHRQHVANVHRNYGKHVGLVSKRGTNKLRYAPTDGLLKTLVLANVEHRLELGEFLRRLFDRYGLIFGDREAEVVLAHADHDKKAFQANARRLEQRLGSLGMLRRLSDSCAYVENPLARRGG